MSITVRATAKASPLATSFSSLRRAFDAIGLGDVRFHDLRHAYATRLLERGVHPKVVSEALGHSSISITMDTYSHVMPSMSQVAADAIDAVLGE